MVEKVCGNCIDWGSSGKRSRSSTMQTCKRFPVPVVKSKDDRCREFVASGNPPISSTPVPSEPKQVTDPEVQPALDTRYPMPRKRGNKLESKKLIEVPADDLPSGT